MISDCSVCMIMKKTKPIIYKPKKKPKKKRFHTGTHISPKSLKPMDYRSGWELQFMQKLDKDQDVKSYQYETIIVPYLKNPRAKKVSKYFPDFIVEYQDGRTVIYEIKSSSFLLRKMNLAKWEACEKYCTLKGWKFEVLTEVELKVMGLLGAVKEIKD